MKKRNWIIAGVLLSSIIGGVIFVSWPAREPEYQGKELSVWLREMDNGIWPRKGSLATVQAIREMGTNTFPCLENMLNSEDSPFGLKLKGFLRRHWPKPLDFPNRNQRQLRALSAFVALGPKAKTFVPTVAKQVSKMSPGPQVAALMALEEMGAEAEAAVPEVTQIAQSRESSHRYYAMQVLAAISYRHPEVVLPIFQKGLQDTNVVMQKTARNAIGLLDVYQQDNGPRGLFH